MNPVQRLAPKHFKRIPTTFDRLMHVQGSWRERNALERSRTALTNEAETRALRECYASLSRRERELMALVVSGRLNKQLGITWTTRMD